MKWHLSRSPFVGRRHYRSVAGESTKRATFKASRTKIENNEYNNKVMWRHQHATLRDPLWWPPGECIMIYSMHSSASHSYSWLALPLCFTVLSFFFTVHHSPNSLCAVFAFWQVHRRSGQTLLVPPVFCRAAKYRALASARFKPATC